MSEAYVKVEELLGEVKARMLSVPCPQCGEILPRGKVKPGEEVECTYCGTVYSVERSLNETSATALSNLVAHVINDAVGRFDAAVDGNVEELSSLLRGYANQVLKETRNLHDSLGRLPSREELDIKLREGTQQILETIASSSKKLLDGQENISIKVDSVKGTIDSVKISITEIKRLLECVKATNGKDWRIAKPKGKATLLYQDMENRTRELNVENAIIGKTDKGWELTARFPRGETQHLGLADPTVSRKHIQIAATEEAITVVDLESKNGTYINGRRIQANVPTKVQSGDEIKIGLNTKFTLRYHPD